MTSDCIFCNRDDATLNRVLCENAGFFARYDNFAVSRGHVEVVPKRHVESLFSLTDAELVQAFDLLGLARQALEAEYAPDGYNVGVNEGGAAGRTVNHLHIHLIPRYDGDIPDPRGGIRNILPGPNADRWLA